ncbi:hypothetical protein [Zoogloea sp.]|uniref:hypothetical protein n=1 Tax=Zoogloea sp. TaxID=49181 RepID=UPI0035B07934
MSGLAVTRSIILGEGGDAPLAVTVRELTVGEIRSWLKEVQSQSPEIDVVDVMLLRDVSLQDVARLTSLTPAQIETLGPSKLREVVAVAREINEDFFGLRAGLLSVAAAIPLESSSAQSPA